MAAPGGYTFRTPPSKTLPHDDCSMSADKADAFPSTLPDASPKNIVERFLPLSLHPYAQLARWDRPIGWWLLLLPCWWATALAGQAASSPPDIVHLLLFLLGAVSMRGAGSTWNDILDCDLDAKVARTRARPLPSGAVSLRQAALFLTLQLLVGLGVLLCFNLFSIVLGFAAMLPVLIYPLMKRITNHPQVVLGLAFSWGALMGWAVLFGSLSAPPLLMYAAAILWTVGYDTIYALQDIEDDAVVGIGSTARAYGDHSVRFVGFCYAGAVVLVGLALLANAAGIVSFVALAAFAAHLGWQVAGLKLDEPALALRFFRSNRDAGLILFAGLSMDAVLRWLALH